MCVVEHGLTCIHMRAADIFLILFTELVLARLTRGGATWNATNREGATMAPPPPGRRRVTR